MKANFTLCFIRIAIVKSKITGKDYFQASPRKKTPIPKNQSFLEIKKRLQTDLESFNCLESSPIKAHSPDLPTQIFLLFLV